MPESRKPLPIVLAYFDEPRDFSVNSATAGFRGSIRAAAVRQRHNVKSLSLRLIKTAMKIAEIHTKKGVMKIKFFEKDAPNTVKNFIELAEHNFYDGIPFHRVIPDFMIQGGCPNGIGNGGPGYKIKCELDGENQYHDRGVLSMAHAGRDTGGSQFFICHSRKNTAHLDRNHTVFGKVYEGVDVIDQIRQGDVMEKVVIRDVEEQPA